MLKRILHYLSVFIIFFFVSNYSFSSHYQGGSITYTCTSNNTYLVQLELYRDCDGVSFSTTEVIQYTSASCGISANVTMNFQSQVDISQLCSSSTSVCAGGIEEGLELVTYTGVLTLPSNSCSDWELSYSGCCRSAGVGTLVNPGVQPYYLETTLDNTLTSCNNSPIFNSGNDYKGCVGVLNNYDASAFDPDGDSLVYSLINAQQSNGLSVVYAGGYSGLNPINGGPTINPQTGQVSFTPLTPIDATIAVLVQEFRNGILIGSVIKEVAYSVQNCSNIDPVLSSMDGTPGLYQKTVCAGSQVCFSIISTDVNSGQNITLSSSSLIPNVSFFQTGSGNNVTGNLCWTPPVSTPPGIYYFPIIATDDGCPDLGQTTEIYSIVVQPSAGDVLSINGGVSPSICFGDSVILTASHTGPSTISTVSWSPNSSVSSPNSLTTYVTPSSSTVYSVSASYTNGCQLTQNLLVNIASDPIATISQSNTNVCGGSTFLLTGVTDAPGMNFQWLNPALANLGSGTVSGVSSNISVTVPSAAGSYVYTLLVTNPSTGCSEQATVTLSVGVPPSLSECLNIYVSPTGSAGSPGTQASPTTLAQALNMAACNNTVIKMAGGTYNIDNPINLSSFLTIEGGFDQAFAWRKISVPGYTTINRTTANPEGASGAQRLVAMYGNSTTDFRLQDITITTSNAFGAGMSTYGVHLTNCSNYNIVRTQILPGNAAAGLAGFNGGNGIIGRNGGNGTGGNDDSDNDAGAGGGGGGGGGTTLGTPGNNSVGNFAAQNVCVRIGGGGGIGGATAGNGGNGASDGNGCGCCGAGVNGVNGASSTNQRSGGGGGGGGSGGEDDEDGGNGGTGGGVLSTFGLNFSGGQGGDWGNPGDDGQNGGIGNTGANGTNGALGSFGSYVGGFWLPGGQGSAGTNGRGGAGGRGGGGGGGESCTFCTDGAGSGGGGGGGGGQGGAGGLGGSGGGASFCLFLVANGVNGNVTQCNFVAGNLGPGGFGGSGGNGGNGGNGGLGSTYTGGDVGRGGNGGNGGDGGDGGNGGNGRSGVASISQILSGSPLSTSQATFNLAAQPLITASNINCTSTNVTFTTGGSTTWNFTPSATPQSPVGTNVITQFSTINRYDIVAGANTYAGFHNISYTNTISPTITTSANPIGVDTFEVCEGTSVSFGTPSTALFYSWNFSGGAANPTSAQNVTSAFNTPGFYPIILSIATDCCGSSPPDTIYLYVTPIPSVTGTGNISICSGSNATLSIVGLSPTDSVIWTPTSNQISSTSNSITVNPNQTTTYVATISSSISAGGQIITSCPVSLNYTVTVNPLPTIAFTSVDPTCNNNGSLVANITSGGGQYNFIWSDGYTTFNSVSSSNTGLSAGSYTVTATNVITGCSVSATTILNTGAGSPSIYVASSTVSCYGQNDGTMTVGTIGGTGPFIYSWTSPASGSGNSQTGMSPGAYTISVTDGNGCQSSMNASIYENPELHVHVTNNGPFCAGNTGIFTLAGHVGYTLVYNVGAGNVTLNFTSDSMLVTIPGVSTNQTLTLVSLTDGICTDAPGTTNVLQVSPGYAISENVSVCPNATYIYPDGTSAVITTNTTYVSNLLTSLNCDSTITTNVTLNPVYNLTENVSTCPNSTVTYPDGTTAVITANTSYTSNMMTTAGCDSIITTNVTLSPAINVTSNMSICPNGTITYPDGTTATITANTTQVSTLTSSAGCDSIVTTIVALNPVYNLSENISVCENSTVTYPDGSTAIITGNTSFVSNMMTLAGCDSVITTNVTMEPIYSNTENVNACENSTYTYPDGSTMVITGNTSHVSNLLTTANCDSIITTNVTMNPSYSSTQNVNACENSTITYPDGTTAVINGNTSYVSNLLTTANCDSVITTNVTMDPIYNTTENVNVCENSTVTYPDGTTAVITGNTSYVSSLMTTSNCDSIITTNVTMDPIYNITENVIACENSTYTYPDGTTAVITANTSYVSSLLTIGSGCDSIITTNVTMNPVYAITQGVSVCPNSSFTYPDGTTAIITANTTYVSSLVTTTNCDSIITTNVTLSPEYNLIETMTACQNTIVTYPDGTTATITANTSYTSSLFTVAGCDSIITTNVTLAASINTTNNVNVCPNGTVTYPDGSSAVITTNTTQISTFISSTGCDSIITTNVTVNPVYNLSENVNACENSTYTYPDGSTVVITTNSTYVSNLFTLAGCDSIITTNVTMDPIYNITENVIACENSTYTYPDGTTAVITANTSYVSNLLTIGGGCDSIITSNVIMNPIYNFTENVNACENSTYTYPDGSSTVITGNTSYVSVLMTVTNCDSVITTNVTMNPSYNITENVNACENSTYTYPDGSTAVITASTSYVSNLSTTASCDSIITTTVTMDPVYNITQNVNVCENSSYTYPDGSTTVISASTVYVSSLMSASNCDSIITTNVTMDPIYNITENVNACENSTYTYPDGSTALITTNTSHVSNLSTTASCDSIITTNVTMNPVYNITQNVSACQNSTIVYPDGTTAIITTNTSYISNILSVAGCDSIITTNVAMVTAYNVTNNVNICPNGTVTYPDGTSEVITANTTQISTLLSTTGCDSIITTNVTMNPVYNLSENVNACENSTYTYPDGTTTIVTANASYVSNMMSVAGCDSIITTNLTMDPIYNITENVNACENSTYTYPDGSTAVITANTSHVSNLSTLASCDSIITTNVTMDPVYNITQNVTACQNAAYTYPDGSSIVVVSNSTYISSLMTTTNCDSIITTNITMVTTYNVTNNVGICPNGTVTYPDGTSAVITANTTQISTLLSTTGCDSIVTTNVTMNPVYNLSENVNACENSTITYPDGTTAIVTANTSYVSNMLTAAGCDSIITTNVAMDPIYSITENVNACENSTYTYPDGSTAVITANTSHISNLSTIASCDSIITTNVTMDSVYSITQNVNVCENSTYTYPDGSTAIITASTAYVSSLTSASNCDSIVTTNITMNPVYSNSESVAICENGTVTYPDGTIAVITGNTTYVSNLLTINGCDSIITTTVLMDPVYNITQNLNACENATVTYPDGATAVITTNSSYVSSLQTIAGCDSIITTNVTMDPIYNITQNVNACENSTYTYPDGSTAVITGNASYVSVLSTTASCDSIITTNVTMDSVYSSLQNVNVCENSTITYPDGTSAVINANTSYTSNLITVSGCDSIIVTAVTMNPIYSTTVAINVCENTTVTYPDGTTALITANTSYTSNLLSISGCDSLVITNVTMDPEYTITQNVNACENSTYTYPDGSSIVVVSNSTYISSLMTSAGCDSIITTNLTMDPLPVSGGNAVVSLCTNGGSVNLYTQLIGLADLGGVWTPAMASSTGFYDPLVDPSGTYTYTVTNFCGTSSSTVQVSLIPNPNPGTNGNITLCQNSANVDLFSLIGTADLGGVWTPTLNSGTGMFNPSIDPSGNYMYSITTTCGVFTSNVQVTLTPLDNASFIYPSNVFCTNDLPVAANITGLAGGMFTISGSGVIDPLTGQIDIVGSGPGVYVVTYTTNGACPNSQNVTVTIANSADATITLAGPFCEYDAPFQLIAAQPGGVWSGTGVDPVSGIFNPGVAVIGANPITYTIAGPCGDVQTVNLDVFAAPVVSTINNTTISLPNSITLTTTSSSNNLVWTPDESLSCSNCLNPIATPQETITYTVTAMENGCFASDEVTITVLFDQVIFVPNIFSPNGDDQNDVLYVRGKGVKDLRFIIYNRWGEKVFESTSLEDGWDGTFRGEKMNPAVFVYYVDVTFTDGTEETKKGNVTLIR